MADQEMDDRELLVQMELVSIQLFGFDTYKHENRDRAARLRKELDELTERAIQRKLWSSSGPTQKGRELDHESDPKVERLVQQNEQFIKSRMR